MSEVMIARARVEPGKEDRLREWYDELHERESEVIETLQHEGVHTETAFIDSVGDALYLVLYMEAADLEKAREAGAEEAYTIDEEHHAILSETLAGDWQEMELLGHFANPSRE